MNIIDDLSIDFDAYLREPDESAHVIPASSYADQIIDRFYNPQTNHGARLPWGKHEFTIQFRPGEVSLWLGMNGHGKSMALGQLMTSFMAQGEKALILSFEMKPVATLARMCRQAAQCAEPSMKYIKEFSEWTDGKLWMYDQQGTVKTSRVIAVCRYFATELKGTHIVIDSLMKCGIAEDDYNGQKAFVDELTSIARDHRVHIHLVHHSRKLANEDSPPGKMDAKGTGAITDLVDNCVTIWRNKKKEAQAAQGKESPTDPDALMIVDKQRHGEWDGRIALWFHKQSQQYLCSPSARTIDLQRVEA